MLFAAKEKRMSQVNVERVIGQLVTDEGVRRRFVDDPHAALRQMMECGVELTEGERSALAGLDRRELERFVESIDARLQKTDLRGDCR
jgi:hypothetical protein